MRRCCPSGLSGDRESKTLSEILEENQNHNPARIHQPYCPAFNQVAVSMRTISPEMAVRLSKVFGGSAESWLTQQAHYDLAQVRADRIKLKRLELTVGLSA